MQRLVTVVCLFLGDFVLVARIACAKIYHDRPVHLLSVPLSDLSRLPDLPQKLQNDLSPRTFQGSSSSTWNARKVDGNYELLHSGRAVCPLARNSWGQLVGTSVDTLVGAHRRYLMSMSVGTPVGTLVIAFVRASLAVVVGDGGQHSQGACAQAWHLSIKEY